VVLASLATALPTTDRPDVEARADLIVAALIEYGHLPKPDTAPTPEDMERLAEWLGTESRFPRYTTPNIEGRPGWMRLLVSDADVNVATHKAMQYAVTDEQRDEIRRASWLLLRWCAEHSTTTAPSDREDTPA
jgi:hypothetical protein